MTEKACKKCRILVEGNHCPLCKGTNLSDNWKGRVVIVDPDKSEVAKKLGLKSKGEFAIKIS